MLHWKVWNYFVISHLWRNLIGFFEKCEIFVILIWLAKVKCHLRGCHRNVVGRVFNFGRGRRRSSLFPCFFELEREQPVCFLITTCRQNTKNIKRRCSVFSKVETLAVCCESGTTALSHDVGVLCFWHTLLLIIFCNSIPTVISLVCNFIGCTSMLSTFLIFLLKGILHLM